MVKYYIINSELMPVAEAKINVSDLGLLRGYGVFDFFRVREGVPVFIEDHLDRFEQSAEYLGLELPLSKTELIKQVERLVEANDIGESGIRMVLTGGYSPDGYSPAEPNLIIMEHPFKAYDEKVFKDGIKLLLHQYTRDTPLTKTTNYLVPIRLLNKIKAANAADVLYHNGKHISESSRSNIFIVDEDEMISTPKTDALHGITRNKVISLVPLVPITNENGELNTTMKDFGSVQPISNLSLRDITIDELLNATECFITSTTKGVMPVTTIDNHKIGNGQPGPITLKLANFLEQYKLDYIAKKKKIKSA